MKKMILTSLLILLGASAVQLAWAEDDDIYFSKKNARKDAYKETAADVWETHANDDWDLDAYNRRSTAVAETPAAPATDSIAVDSTQVAVSGLYYYDAEKGQISRVQVTEKSADEFMEDMEAYYYSNRIHRFHNRFFGFYAYNPYYDIAYYDPFYWDYCYYDPWWYCTPSFGYHWGNWYWGWNYGYYSGWYGGWYAPYYHCHPHYYEPHYAWGGGVVGGHIDHSTRGGRRSNTGAHFVNRGDRHGSSRPTRDGQLGGATRGGGSRAALPSADGQRQRNNMRAQDLAGRSGSQVSGGRATAGGTRTTTASTPSGRGTTASASRSTSGSRSSFDNSAARRSGSTATPSRQQASSGRSSNSSAGYSNNAGSYTSRGGYSSSSSSSSTRSSSSSSSSSSRSYSGGSSYSGGGSRGGGYSGGGGGGGSRGGGGGRR